MNKMILYIFIFQFFLGCMGAMMSQIFDDLRVIHTLHQIIETAIDRWGWLEVKSCGILSVRVLKAFLPQQKRLCQIPKAAETLCGQT